MAKSTYTMYNFKHPKLTDEELVQGTRLGFDTWADTSCAGRHAFIESFVEGKTVNAVGFSSSLGALENLPIVNAVYAYDFNDGRTILLENCNAIYVGESMEDSLVNPLQCEDNGVKVDLHPLRFYPQHEDECQQLSFEDGTNIPLIFDGVLPCIMVRRPNSYELDTCKRLKLTSDNDWDLSNFNSLISNISTVDGNNNEHTADDDLLSHNIAELMAAQLLLYEHNEYYCAINAFKIKTRMRIPYFWHL